MLRNKFFTVLGILLGTTGIALLLYSIYLMFFIPSQQDLVRILPKENFQFFLSDNTEQKHAFSMIAGEDLPKSPFLAGYKNEEGEIAFLSLQEKKGSTPQITSPEIVCEAFSRYLLCVSEADSTTLYAVLEALKEEKSSLYSLRPFHTDEADLLLPKESTISFFGDTSSLQHLVQTDIFPESISIPHESVVTISTILKDSVPYFSGTVNTQENVSEYQIIFHKKNGELIFPTSLSQYPFPYNIFQTEYSFLFLRSPQQILDFVEQNTPETEFPITTKLYHETTKMVEELFYNKASFEDDIAPLLLTDTLWIWNTDAVATLFSLPASSLAHSLFTKFDRLFLDIAKETLPEKKGFLLQDGSMIYEMVPSSKNVQHITDSIEERGNFSAYHTSSQENTGKEQSVFSLDSYLGIGNNTEFTESQWEKISSSPSVEERENSIFLFSKIRGSDISFLPETLPIKKIGIEGKELEDSIHTRVFVYWE